MLSVPRLLRDYRPTGPEHPIQRLVKIVDAVVATLGQDPDFYIDLCGSLFEVHGANIAYESIVYRASGLLTCEVCNRRYFDHKPCPELVWARSLCNGDLVKL